MSRTRIWQDGSQSSGLPGLRGHERLDGVVSFQDDPRLYTEFSDLGRSYRERAMALFDEMHRLEILPKTTIASLVGVSMPGYLARIYPHMQGKGLNIDEASVLDVCAGIGVMGVVLKGKHPKIDYVGLDNNQIMANLAANNGVNVVHGSILDPPETLRGRTFDFVVMVNSLFTFDFLSHKSTERDMVLANMAGFTRSGGVCIFDEINGMPFSTSDYEKNGFALVGNYAIENPESGGRLVVLQKR